MSCKTKTYIVEATSDHMAVPDILSRQFEVTRKSATTLRHTYLDTFDRRLFRNGYVLTKSAETCTLQPLSGTQAHQTVKLDTTDADLTFWWQAPAGELRETLRTVIGVRALMPGAHVRIRKLRYHVCDTEKSPPTELDLSDVTINAELSDHDRSLATLTIFPSKGGRKQRRAIRDILLASGIKLQKASLHQAVFTAIGKTPGDSPRKPTLSLTPEMPAATAVKRILANLLHTIRSNEEGILQDIDTEFLHDFRVAIRRTRVLLSQLKDVFPRQLTDRYKAQFAALAKSTNELRDLDVFLLQEPVYRDMLPCTLHAGLEALFLQLRQNRKVEHAKLKKKLRGAAYKKLMQAWEDFLTDGAQTDETSAHAGTPVLDVAKRVIFKRHAKICRIGKQVAYSGSDDALHALRLEFKKLRYAVEFYFSLFPERDISALLKQLKRIQKHLGDFNDLAVQQEKLMVLLQQQFRGHADATAVSASVGGLVALLHHNQQQVRAECSRTFSGFLSKKTRSVYKHLFG